MSPGRRVHCVTGDPEVADHVRAILSDVAPDIDCTAVERELLAAIDADALAVVTDVGVDDPVAAVSGLLDATPGVTVLFATRLGDVALASDALAAGATAVSPLDDADRLGDRLAWLLGADGGRAGFADRFALRRKLGAFHDVATALAEAESPDTVQALVLDVADTVLDLDACYYLEHHDDHFVVSASSTDRKPERTIIPDGSGVASETLQERRAILVDDAQTDPSATPTSEAFRSGISVPVGEHGVFQAIASDPGAFTAADLELADLLATHAAIALDRVAFAAAIRSERDRLGALFENVPNPVVEYEQDATGSFIATAVNPAFESVFGYSADEFVGGDIDELIVPPADRECARSFNEDLREGRNVTGEVRRITADGIRDFILDVVPLSIDEPNDSGYASYTDITEQKQRERQLARQNERLEEFASVVSHDLRNPLNVAMGRMELAAGSSTGDAATHLSEARDALDRMDDLIGDLLELAREGRSLGDTEPVELARLAREAWSSVRTDTATLVVDDPPVVVADADRVRQLLENLFRNSVEHGRSADSSAPDGARDDGITVTIAATPAGFSVADDGVGIPPDVLDRVLTSGYSSSDQGTGFGLAIVERIALAHDWTVDVSTPSDGGVRFDFGIHGE